MSDLKSDGEQMRIRKMSREDVPVFLSLIRALADYENLPPPDAEAQARLRDDAMADQPRFSVLLAERTDNVVAYAVFFETYSTFLARPTLYLEDIFVTAEERRKGVGKALFVEVAREAVRRDCGRLEWQVLAWNTPAIRFYQKLGASQLCDWQPYRLMREEFSVLAGNH